MGEEKSRKTPFQKIIPSRNEKERIYKSLLSCFFGKILGQAHSPPRRGVSRAALLASSITVRKSAERKQRTYRPTSLRGVAAPPKKMPRSHRSGADGVVRPAKPAPPLRGGEYFDCGFAALCLLSTGPRFDKLTAHHRGRLQCEIGRASCRERVVIW